MVGTSDFLWSSSFRCDRDALVAFGVVLGVDLAHGGSMLCGTQLVYVMTVRVCRLTMRCSEQPVSDLVSGRGFVGWLSLSLGR
jgi:hypothetical protein